MSEWVGRGDRREEKSERERERERERVPLCDT